MKQPATRLRIRDRLKDLARLFIVVWLTGSCVIYYHTDSSRATFCLVLLIAIDHNWRPRITRTPTTLEVKT